MLNIPLFINVIIDFHINYPNIQHIDALDVIGNDVDAIVGNAIKEAEKIAKSF